MKRRRRTEILIQGSPQLAKRLAEVIRRQYDIQILEPPQQILIMVKAREGAKRSLFYLGEVLSTQAKVAVEGKIGLGILAGEDEETALNLAVIDGAYQANLPETREWEASLLEEEARIIEKNQFIQAQLAKTKVNFQTMEGQLS